MGLVEKKRVSNCGCSRRSERQEYGCVAVNAVVGDSKKEWELMGTKLLFEKMKEERARRDEAVEKWKQLYLAIKTELDDLIQRTYDGVFFYPSSLSPKHGTHYANYRTILCVLLGEGVYWKAEENDGHVEVLKRELEEKEGVIKTLKAELDSMEHEKIKKEREFDLLKQSLRIINGMKHSTIKTKEKLMKRKQGR
ncbi:FKBP12-interacting protein of 37 kDa [Senna tora]|uniref:FKBP12-interacting protein of 37 kDa n=1 Tax=Senna tora TaxID=362788 RepID=A0A834SUF5_9FABA|nr:FKBP12-interacting protein of 37 kDa [Senna tora]